MKKFTLFELLAVRGIARRATRCVRFAVDLCYSLTSAVLILSSVEGSLVEGLLSSLTKRWGGITDLFENLYMWLKAPPMCHANNIGEKNLGKTTGLLTFRPIKLNLKIVLQAKLLRDKKIISIF